MQKKHTMRQKINNLLKQYNIKQQQLADAIGIPRQNVQMYLYGNRRFTIDAQNKFFDGIKKICDQRIGEYIKLKHDLNKLIMDMSNRHSIGDV